MSKLSWDGVAEKAFEYGVSKGVMYEINSSGVYATGYAWNGLREVQVNPEGGEANDIWADNIKYGTLRGAEDVKGSISAYTYPPQFEQMNGRVNPVTGMYVSGQPRKTFGLCFRSEIGDDTDVSKGYKIHLLYGVTVDPSDETYETVNDNPEAKEMSWDFSTIPVAMTGQKPTAYIMVDSRTASSSALKTLEAQLYGDTSVVANLPTPDQVLTYLGGSVPQGDD